MNLIATLLGLWRRWYIVVPGVVLAIGLALGAWLVVPPGYERTASQLLLPGTQSMPSDANPFLYLGGLSNVADVVVRAVGSDNVINEVQKRYPRAEVEVTRDVSNSGPFILITVTGSSDAEAKAVMGIMLQKTITVLADLQNDERVTTENRITVIPISVDDRSVLQQRERLVTVGGVGVVIVALTLLVAGLVDGLIIQRRRRAREDDDVELQKQALPPNAPATLPVNESEPETVARSYEDGDPHTGSGDLSAIGEEPVQRQEAAEGADAAEEDDDPFPDTNELPIVPSRQHR